MEEEMELLKANHTWTLIPRHNRVQVFVKLKEGINPSNSIEVKARLVSKKYTQNQMLDYNKIFLPIIKSKITSIFSIVVKFYLEFKQLDVKTNFFHSNLDKKIYMTQLAGLIIVHHSN